MLAIFQQSGKVLLDMITLHTWSMIGYMLGPVAFNSRAAMPSTPQLIEGDKFFIFSAMASSVNISISNIGGLPDSTVVTRLIPGCIAMDKLIGFTLFSFNLLRKNQ